MARLNKGDAAPDFRLEDSTGTQVRLSDFRGRKVLLYFFPKAGTSGCTVQTEAVRDAQKALVASGVVSLGVSPDGGKSLKRFSDRLSLNFPLLSDADHRTAEDYGVWGEKSMYGKKYFGIIRSSFLIDEQGRVMQAWYTVSPSDTVPNAMKALGQETPT
jgi:peroxiredoxin Q/BCP